MVRGNVHIRRRYGRDTAQLAGATAARRDSAQRLVNSEPAWTTTVICRGAGNVRTSNAYLSEEREPERQRRRCFETGKDDVMSERFHGSGLAGRGVVEEMYATV